MLILPVAFSAEDARVGLAVGAGLDDDARHPRASGRGVVAPRRPRASPRANKPLLIDIEFCQSIKHPIDRSHDPRIAWPMLIPSQGTHDRLKHPLTRPLTRYPRAVVHRLKLLVHPTQRCSRRSRSRSVTARGHGRIPRSHGETRNSWLFERFCFRHFPLPLPLRQILLSLQALLQSKLETKLLRVDVFRMGCGGSGCGCGLLV